MSRARDLADGTFSGAFAADSPTLVVDDTNNRVGVGTASPAAKVHVADATTPELIVEDTTNNVKAVVGADNSVGRIGTDTNHDVTFRTNDTERMRLLSGGGLAIGTSSSPNSAPLLVHCATDDNIRIKQETHAAIQAVNDAASAFTELKLDGSSLLLNSQSGGNSLVGGSTSYYSSGKLQVDGGKVIFRSSDASYGTFQLGVLGTEASMAYIPNVTGFGTNPSSSSGDNAIFVTGPGAYGQSATEYVIGNKGRGGYVAKVAYNGTSWTFNSDERLKDIEGEIENALDKLGVIRAIYYRWKNDEAQQRQVGVIAQEVQAVLPEAVDVPEIETNEDGTTNYWGVGYTDLIPLLIASVKELNTKVEACEAKNTEQQALIEDLQTRLAALETP
jgi:hypothetical protein